MGVKFVIGLVMYGYLVRIFVYVNIDLDQYQYIDISVILPRYEGSCMAYRHE